MSALQYNIVLIFSQSTYIMIFAIHYFLTDLYLSFNNICKRKHSVTKVVFGFYMILLGWNFSQAATELSNRQSEKHKCCFKRGAALRTCSNLENSTRRVKYDAGLLGKWHILNEKKVYLLIKMDTGGGRFLCRLVGFKASAHQPDIKLSHFKASCTCSTRCIQLEYSVWRTHINSHVGVDGGEDAETQL